MEASQASGTVDPLGEIEGPIQKSNENDEDLEIVSTTGTVIIAKRPPVTHPYSCFFAEVPCPMDCSEKGNCSRGACSCFEGYFGNGCECKIIT